MILSSPFLILLRYWVAQGVFYMNRAELLHRFMLEAVLIIGCLVIVAPAFSSNVAGIIISLIIGHTINLLINGHPFAVLAHDAGVHSVCFYRNKEDFLRYVESMRDNLNRKKPDYLDGALVFGSIVKGVFRETSDLDVRYIAKPGFWNAFRTANLVFIERLKANIKGFPMDIYMFRDKRETENKMNVSDEPPVSLYSYSNNMEKLFGKIFTLEEMSNELARNENNEPDKKSPRAIVVASGGGHLAEALLAIEGIPLRATIATLRLPHTEKTLKGVGWKHYYLIDPHGNVVKYFLNIFQSMALVLRDRPDYVISTGAGMAIPTCIIGKLLGAKLIFIETAARVTTASKTGKLLYPLADLFLVQWEPLLKIYPKAKHGGVLL